MRWFSDGVGLGREPPLLELTVTTFTSAVLMRTAETAEDFRRVEAVSGSAQEIEVERIAKPGDMTDVVGVDCDCSESFDRFDKSYEVDYEVESMSGRQYAYAASEERDDFSVRCTESGCEVRLARSDDGRRMYDAEIREEKLPKVHYDPAFFDECNRLLAKLDSSSHHDMSLPRHLLEKAADEDADEMGAGTEGGDPEGVSDHEEGVEEADEEAVGPGREEGKPVRRNVLQSLLMQTFQQEFNERCRLAEIDGPLRPGQHRVEKDEGKGEDEEAKAKKRRWLEKIDQITREAIQGEDTTGLKTVTEEDEENANSGSIHSGGTGGTETTTVHTNHWDSVSISEKFEMARCAINGEIFATRIIEDTNHILEDLNAAADEAKGCGTTGGAQSGPERSKEEPKGEEGAGNEGARPPRPPPAAINKRSNRKMLSTIDEPAGEEMPSSPRDNLPPSPRPRPSSPRNSLPPTMSPSAIQKRLTINNLSSDEEATGKDVPKMCNMPVSPSSFHSGDTLPKAGSDTGAVAQEAKPPVVTEPTENDAFFAEIKRKALTSSVNKSLSKSDQVLHLVAAAADDVYGEDAYPAAQDGMFTLASDAEPAASFVSDDDALLRRKRWHQANARRQKHRILEEDMSSSSLPVGRKPEIYVQPEIVALPDDEKKAVALECMREEKVVLPFDEPSRSVVDGRKSARSDGDAQSTTASASKCHSVTGTQSVQADTSHQDEGAGPLACGEPTSESRSLKAQGEGEAFSTSHKVTSGSQVNGRLLVGATTDNLSVAMSLGQSTLTSRLTLGDVEKEERVASIIESQLAAVEENTADKESASSVANSVGIPRVPSLVEGAATDDLSVAMSLGQSTLTSRLTLDDVEKEERVAIVFESRLAAVEEGSKENTSTVANSLETPGVESVTGNANLSRKDDEETASKAPSLCTLTTSVRYQTKKIAELEAEAQRRWKEAEQAAAASRKALQEMVDRRSRAKKEARAQKQGKLTEADKPESGSDLSVCSTLSSNKNTSVKSSKYSEASRSQCSQSKAAADPAATSFPSTSAQLHAESKKSTLGLEPEVIQETEETDTAQVAVGLVDTNDTKREISATPPVQVRSSILPPLFHRSYSEEEGSGDGDSSTAQSTSTASSYQSDLPSRSMAPGSGYPDHRSSSATRTGEMLQTNLLLPSLNSPSRSRLRGTSPRALKPNFLKPYSKHGDFSAGNVQSGHRLYQDVTSKAHPREPVPLRPSLAGRTSSGLIAGRRKPSLAVRTTSDPVSLAARTTRLPPRLKSLTPRTDYESFTFDSVDERSRRRQAADRGFDSLLLAQNQTVRERMSNNSNIYGQNHLSAARERLHYISETLPSNIPVSSPSFHSSSSALPSHTLQHPRRSVRFAEDHFSNPAPFQQPPPLYHTSNSTVGQQPIQLQPAPIQQPPPLYHTAHSAAGQQSIQLPPMQYQPMENHTLQPIHQLQPQLPMGHPQYYQPSYPQAGTGHYRC